MEILNIRTSNSYYSANTTLYVRLLNFWILPIVRYPKEQPVILSVIHHHPLEATNNVIYIIYLVDAKFLTVVTSNSAADFCISEDAEDLLSLGAQGYCLLRNDTYQ